MMFSPQRRIVSSERLTPSVPSAPVMAAKNASRFAEVMEVPSVPCGVIASPDAGGI
jgi:hypothetical protein